MLGNGYTVIQTNFLSGTSGNDIINPASLLEGIGIQKTKGFLEYGGNGNDYLYGTANNDILFGGSGNDVIYGNGGNDVIDGGSEDDKLYSPGGGSFLYGENGNDFLSTAGVGDMLIGGAGADTFQITKTAATGNVTIKDMELVDKIDLQTFDSIDFSKLQITKNGTDSIIKLSQNETLTLQNFDATKLTKDNFIFIPKYNNITGTDSDDILNGTSDDDYIITGKGNNKVNAGSGNDVILSQGNIDTIYGGAGKDKIILENNTGSKATKYVVDFVKGDDLIDLTHLGKVGVDWTIAGMSDVIKTIDGSSVNGMQMGIQDLHDQNHSIDLFLGGMSKAAVTGDEFIYMS